MAPKSIPERWEPYTSIGYPVRGTRFIAFKVPLKEHVCARLQPKHRWTIDTLCDTHPDIGMIIDLTMTTRYYDFNDVLDKGVDYCKIPLPGQKIPSDALVKRFFAAVDFYLDRRHDGSLIGVHCTHGVNRTGYMIARYLIQRMGYSVSDALESITVARGHPIERENYVSHLGLNTIELPKLLNGRDIQPGRLKQTTMLSQAKEGKFGGIHPAGNAFANKACRAGKKKKKKREGRWKRMRKRQERLRQEEEQRKAPNEAVASSTLHECEPYETIVLDSSSDENEDTERAAETPESKKEPLKGLIRVRKLEDLMEMRSECMNETLHKSLETSGLLTASTSHYRSPGNNILSRTKTKTVPPCMTVPSGCRQPPRFASEANSKFQRFSANPSLIQDKSKRLPAYAKDSQSSGAAVQETSFLHEWLNGQKHRNNVHGGEWYPQVASIEREPGLSLAGLTESQLPVPDRTSAKNEWKNLSNHTPHDSLMFRPKWPDAAKTLQSRRGYYQSDKSREDCVGFLTAAKNRNVGDLQWPARNPSSLSQSKVSSVSNSGAFAPLWLPQASCKTSSNLLTDSFDSEKFTSKQKVTKTTLYNPLRNETSTVNHVQSGQLQQSCIYLTPAPKPAESSSFRLLAEVIASKIASRSVSAQSVNPERAQPEPQQSREPAPNLSSVSTPLNSYTSPCDSKTESPSTSKLPWKELSDSSWSSLFYK